MLFYAIRKYSQLRIPQPPKSQPFTHDASTIPTPNSKPVGTMKEQNRFRASALPFIVVIFLFSFLFMSSFFGYGKGNFVGIVWGVAALYVAGEFFRVLEITPHKIISRGFLGIQKQRYPLSDFQSFRRPRFYEAGDIVGILHTRKKIHLKLPLFSRKHRKRALLLCQQALEAKPSPVD